MSKVLLTDVVQTVTDALDNKKFIGHVNHNAKYVWQTFGVISEHNAKWVVRLAAKFLDAPELEEISLTPWLTEAGEIEGERYWARTKSAAERWSDFHLGAKLAIHGAAHA